MSNPYCTLDQFTDFFDMRSIAELSADANGRTADTARVQRLLDAQASKIDLSLTGRYALPLASPPAVLTEWTALLAADVLYGRRAQRPKDLDKRVESAMKMLEQVRAGELGLPGVDRDIKPAVETLDVFNGISRFDNIRFFTDGTEPLPPEDSNT